MSLSGSDESTSIGELVRSRVRDVEDFPTPGIRFKDLTPLLADGPAMAGVTAALGEFGRGTADVVAGIEARGFLFGAPVAHALGLGFVPLRKPGKLPPPVLRQEYALEYGSDALEVRSATILSGSRVLLVDDVLATGGTAEAAVALLRACGAEVISLAVVLEIEALCGRSRLHAIGLTTRCLLAV